MSVIQRALNAFTDTTLPTSYIEPMLNAGSLFLFDPAHPYLAWPSGPNSGSVTIPNVARTSAALLSPSSTVAQLQATMNGSSVSGTANANGVIERTPKGGQHVIISNVQLAAAVNTSASLRPNAGIQAYVLANIGHKFYFSLWHRITRSIAGSDAGKKASFMNAIENNSGTKYLFDMSSDQTYPPAGANLLGYDTTNQNAAGNSFRCVGVQGGTGSPASMGNMSAFQVGRPWSWNRSTNATAPVASSVLYRAYCEDLTVSGRTYAQAKAMDLALYTQDVLTVGGRYYGDTIPTDPATIP